MAKGQSSSFPYASDGSVAPYSDGIILGVSDDLNTSLFLPPPAELTQPAISPAKRGRIIPYIGNTVCVDPYTWANPQGAGDS